MQQIFQTINTLKLAEILQSLFFFTKSHVESYVMSKYLSLTLKACLALHDYSDR